MTDSFNALQSLVNLGVGGVTLVVLWFYRQDVKEEKAITRAREDERDQDMLDIVRNYSTLAEAARAALERVEGTISNNTKITQNNTKAIELLVQKFTKSRAKKA